jgi:hypothetical protein
MKLRKQQPKYTGYVGDHADKLSRIRPIAHDDDERQTREDQHYGETLFNRSPVPMPRLFRRGVWKR